MADEPVDFTLRHDDEGQREAFVRAAQAADRAAQRIRQALRQLDHDDKD